jgi:type IV pilus assembly protein PilW
MKRSWGDNKVRRGLSLVELLVTIVITLILISAIYLSYLTLFKTSQRETVSSEAQIEKAVALEIMRLDIEHAGYGIATNSKDLPIEWNGTMLTIRSVYNVANEKTNKWGVVKCDSSGNYHIITAEPEDFTNSDYVVALEPIGGSTKYVFNGKFKDLCSSVTANRYYLLFSYDGNVTNGCSDQFCNKISYYLKESTAIPNYCLTNSTLIRQSNGRKTPLVYCVYGFTVRFDWGNGTVEENKAMLLTNSTTSASEIRENLKLVRVYLLTQEGGYDPNYLSPENFTVEVDGKSVSFSLPGNPNSKLRHCRWKVITLSVKPMDL